MVFISNYQIKSVFWKLEWKRPKLYIFYPAQQITIAIYTIKSPGTPLYFHQIGTVSIQAVKLYKKR